MIDIEKLLHGDRNHRITEAWLPLGAVQLVWKRFSQFCGMVGNIGGLSRAEYDEFSDALPRQPSEALATNRLAWLKYLSVSTSMLLNIINNEIKKIEAEQK